jgi:alpha-N-arabinofuranosidase
VVTRPGTGEDFDCDWNRVVCEKAVPIADFLIVHFYGPRIGGNDPESKLQVRDGLPEQLERYMAAYRELCVKLGGKELPLAITNTTSATPPTNRSPIASA